MKYAILITAMLFVTVASADPCHYELAGDVDGNCIFDAVDLALLSHAWLVDCYDDPLSPECIPLDIDGDGFDTVVDCNDHNPLIYPGATEICTNGIDDDCDTLIDEDCGFCDGVTDGTACDDGNECTSDDVCSGGVCAGELVPNGSNCGVDDACMNLGACTDGECISDPPLNCDDGIFCTVDSCDPATGCVYAPVHSVCNDANICTTDTCSLGIGCVNVNNTASCDDYNQCTTNDICTFGACIGGPPPNCDDGNPCTDDMCGPLTGCENIPNTDPCDDGNPDTENDVCSGGVCTGDPL